MRKLKNEELGRLTTDTFKETEKQKACLLLDNIRSLNNVGSAFRTADAFLLHKIYLTGITGTPPNREINKTALGATETVDWEHAHDGVALVQQLKSEGWIIIAVEQADQSINLLEFDPKTNKNYCFVFGNEVTGVAEELIALADAVLEIPQFGTKHSLNVSVAIGVVMWDYTSKIMHSE